MSQIQDYPTLFSLAGKTAVVTGGSRGLGLHAATGLLLAGCTKIIITSRKASACADAVKSLQSISTKATILSLPADLSKPAEVERFVRELGAVTDGKVDILIANAGATWGEAFDTHPDAAFDKVMNLNVRSVFNLIRLCTPLLEKAVKESGEKARVVTVGSVAGLHIGGIGEHGTYGYAASKAAVLHLTKHLAVELGPRGILLNAIAPGFFPSKMASALIALSGGEEGLAKETPDGRLGKPEDIVGSIVFLCSRGAEHINGVVLPIDGGKHLVPFGVKL
ncbi:NAD(P)-binding protein [Choiromyces venosus 120613-1]|uniref:NAD(P)-binding protein n=1 Tax=Choiromyces venosus 120613-1 TaxID=1336337 RepID=A0A3N4K6K1_9PEZI|nr:NAD(P)-binding protein [Choiromyces venosus 120613-1]